MLGKRVTLVKAALYCGKHCLRCFGLVITQVSILKRMSAVTAMQLIGGITGAALARGISPAAFQHASGGSNVLIGISSGAGVGIEILGQWILHSSMSTVRQLE